MLGFEEYTPDAYPPLDWLEPSIAFDDAGNYDYDEDDIEISSWQPPTSEVLFSNQDILGPAEQLALHQTMHDPAAHPDDIQAAHDKLIIGNLRYIPRINTVKERCISLTDDDLYQIGAVGLIQALKSWEPNKARLSTHAFFRVTQTLQHERSVADPMIRLPRHMVQQVDEAYSVLDKDIQATTSDVAGMLDLPEKTLVYDVPGTKHHYNASQYAHYLLHIEQWSQPQPYDEPDGDHQIPASQYYIDQDETHDPEMQIDILGNQQVARQMLGTLAQYEDSRLAKIIALQYGFYDGKQWTCKEIGEHIGLGGSRVQQLSQTAHVLLRLLADHQLDPLPMPASNLPQEQSPSSAAQKQPCQLVA